MNRLFSTLFLLAILASCSIEQNTITADIYHDLTAHFNGYYYAREKAMEVEKSILKSLDDDPNHVLLLFPRLDTTLAASYAADTEEIIKMSSISIQRHPNSRWVFENYILVGRARLYDCDFPDAIQTFKYVNTKSKNPDLRHEALVYLVRTFTENGEYDKAEEAFRFLEKESLSKVNRKNLLLEKAYYYQLRNDFDNMVRNLANADSLLTQRDRKGRIYYIIGQVYQQLGFGAEAYNYYRKCLSTNPEYEIDFYARLNMAQVARLDNQKDVKTIRKQFERLLADAKNVEFRDKIYYELGEFERKQNHLPEALDNYKLAAHAGTNKRIQGSAYLKVGQIYFDSLKKYDLAKFYYDSAIASLPKEYDDYQAIKTRQEVLGDFVKYTETIRWQDSLLVMAAMDSATLHKQLDSTLTSRQKQVDAGKKKRGRRNGGSVGAPSGSFFPGESVEAAKWYFGNPSAVALGESEFQRIWGGLTLEDNWRRSNKATVISEEAQATAATATKGEPVAAEEKVDPVAAEIGRVFTELPDTDERKAESLAKIEEAYFMLGDLYFIKLNERNNAADSYRHLIERFPDSQHAAEVLYKLYLIDKDNPDGKSAYYARQLKEDHPNSTFTKVMLNPDYMKQTSVATEKQKMLYKQAYEAYSEGNLREAQELTDEAMKLGETSFTSQLGLLKILITGKTEDVTRYQYELQEYIKKYPDGPVTPYAQELLAASKTFLEKIEKSKGIRFANEPDVTHYVVAVYSLSDKITDLISGETESFNSSIRNKKLETTNLVFNDDMALTMITEFQNKAESFEYLDKLSDWLAQRGKLATHNFDIFVITKGNFQIFYRTKALDEYLTFYDRNYKGQNQ